MGSYGSDNSHLYVDNLTRLAVAKIAPIDWPQQTLSILGVPDILPVIPITPTPISDFSDQARVHGCLRNLDDVLPACDNFPPLAFGQLRTVITIITKWYTSSKKMEVNAGRLHPELRLGSYHHPLIAVRLLTCDGVPSIAYTDVLHRSMLRGKYMDKNIDEIKELCAQDQDDDRLEPEDFAMLIAITHDQKRCGIKPDLNGYYTSRVFYPDSACEQFIIITAKVMLETLEAIENDEPKMRMVELSRCTVPLDGDVDWEDSLFLQVMATIMDDGLRAVTSSGI